MTVLERRRGAIVFSSLLIVGTLAGWAFWPLPDHWPWVLTGAVNALLLAILLATGSRAGWVAPLVIVAGAAVTLFQTWATNELATAAGIRFEPFEGYELLAIALALLAPSPLWVALIAILATGVMPLVQTYHWASSVRQSMPGLEPWMTVFYAVVALIVLLYRRRQLAVERDLVRVQTRADDAERSMRKLLAVRDLANSPLQSIEATLAVLRSGHPECRAQIARIDRQLDRLRTLSTVLSQYGPTTWTADHRSFDPLEILQELEDSPTKEVDRLFLVGPEEGEGRRRPAGEQHKLEQLLRFTSFGLEHAPDCAFWLGEDGRLVYVNQASCRSLGYSRSELLGMHISGFAPQIGRDQWSRDFEMLRREGESPAPVLSAHRRKDGTLVPVEVTASYTELNGRGYVLGFARETGGA